MEGRCAPTQSPHARLLAVPAANKLLAATAFVTVLISLGVLDAAVNRGRLVFPTDSTNEEAQDASAGVRKRVGPDVSAAALREGFLTAETDEESLLGRILPPSLVIASRVLLRGNDRAAAVFWIDSTDMRRHFSTLRQALRASFSTQLRELIDETQTEEGKPPRDVLSFMDPAIRPDRVVFVRVRQRLYEFHVTTGKEKEIDRLVDSLTE